MGVGFGVGLGHGDLFPNTGRLIRLHGWAADFLDEQAGGGEGAVAQHLGVHAEARAAGEEFVAEVFCEALGCGHGGLAVGGGGDQQAVEFFHVPTALAEFDGEPVEQLGV